MLPALMLGAVLAAADPAADSVSTSAPATAVADSVVPATPRHDVGDLLALALGRPMRTEIVSAPTPGLSLTFLPSVGYNPSYGAFVGISLSLGGWLGTPATTLASAGSAGISYSTTGQISVQFKSDFYLPDNQWVLKGDWRYLDTSQPTYGLGPATSGSVAYPMEFVLYRLHETVLRRVYDTNFYVGLGYHFDRYDQIHDIRAEEGATTPFSTYSGGTPSRTQSSGVSVNVLVDTRDNPINARKGVFWNASIRSFNRGLGSDNDRQMIWSDFRSYVRIPHDKSDALAIWNYLWFTFGKAPYLDLPATGWDTYGRGARGFLQGRIRGENQVYTEFEYRKRLSRDDLWGAVVFLNLMGTTIPDKGYFGPMDPGYGIGIRMKFNKRTDTNAAADAARGQDGTTRLFFGLQEVF